MTIHDQVTLHNTQFIIHDQHTQHPISSNSNLPQDWIQSKQAKKSEASFAKLDCGPFGRLLDDGNIHDTLL